MIKGIFFDAAGVLYRRSSPTADFALRLLEQEKFYAKPTDQDMEDLERMRVEASMGKTSYENYWHHFLSCRGVEKPEKRSEMIRKITDFSNDVLPVCGCKTTLAELKNRNFIIGIISDTIYPLEWKMKRLSKAGVAEFIEVIACSTDQQMHKPDPAFYLYAIEQAGLTPTESAFVGHDAKELGGARKAGMTTIAVNYEMDAKADYYCQSIQELLTVPVFFTAN